jgi:hypothetical protein
LNELESERRLTPAQRAAAGSLAWTYGEAIIEAFISADGIRFLLDRRALPQSPGPVAVVPGSFPGFIGSGTEDPLAAIQRFWPINITEFSFRVGSRGDAESSAVLLRFRRWTWRFSGVVLPREAVKAAVRALPRS